MADIRESNDLFWRFVLATELAHGKLRMSRWHWVGANLFQLRPRTLSKARPCYESDARRFPQLLGVIQTQVDVSGLIIFSGSSLMESRDSQRRGRGPGMA